MFICTPRFWLHSVITWAHIFLRACRMVAVIMGSQMLRMLPISGILEGFSTSITSPLLTHFIHHRWARW